MAKTIEDLKLPEPNRSYTIQRQFAVDRIRSYARGLVDADKSNHLEQLIILLDNNLLNEMVDLQNMIDHREAALRVQLSNNVTLMELRDKLNIDNSEMFDLLVDCNDVVVRVTNHLTDPDVIKNNVVRDKLDEMFGDA